MTKSIIAAKRPSTITIPRGNVSPFVKLVFDTMRRQQKTYADVEWSSGVLNTTFKAWRTQTSQPGLFSLTAVLNTLGYTLVAVPRWENIPVDVRDALEDVAQNFLADEEAFAACILAAAQWPGYATDHLWDRLKRPAAPLPNPAYQDQRGAAA